MAAAEGSGGGTRGDVNMKAQARGLMVLAVLCLWTRCGCMALCPPPSPTAVSEFGEVALLDYATCKRLGVVDQEVHRDRDGRLSVTVYWVNRTQKPYLAAIRVAFQDEKGLRERGPYRWDLHPFPLGESELTWISHTGQAVRYRIEVKGAG